MRVAGARRAPVGTEPAVTGAARYARVALDVPIAPWFDYLLAPGIELAPGDWVLVPWGRGRRVGIVLGLADAPGIGAGKVRPVSGRIHEAPAAPPGWLELVDFAARYYHRHPGEVMLPAVPRLLRAAPSARRKESAFARARRRFALPADGALPAPASPAGIASAGMPPAGIPPAEVS